MLEINRKAEVAIHAQAADMEFTIERKGPNSWLMTVEGVSDANLKAGDSGVSEPQPMPRPKQEFILTDAQAAATMALFIGDDAIPDQEVASITTALYDIAEEVWKDVPLHFRPIP
jgi:hypothetical protein